MNKLELKHLSAYLPYGLKVNHKGFDSDGETPWKICTISTIGEECITFDESCRDFYFEDDELDCDIKLILFPLESLTKEIDYAGERFVICKWLFSVEASEEEQFDLYGTIPDYWKTNIKMLKNKDYMHMDYVVVDSLLKHKFDVFNLISQGLAVPVTNDFNPYKQKLCGKRKSRVVPHA